MVILHRFLYVYTRGYPFFFVPELPCSLFLRAGQLSGEICLARVFFVGKSMEIDG
jgi:hypothetical protein